MKQAWQERYTVYALPDLSHEAGGCVSSGRAVLRLFSVRGGGFPAFEQLREGGGLGLELRWDLCIFVSF